MPYAKPEWWLVQRRCLVNLPFLTSVILWIGKSDHFQNNYKYINSLVQQFHLQKSTLHTHVPIQENQNDKVTPCSTVGKKTRMPIMGCYAVVEKDRGALMRTTVEWPIGYVSRRKWEARKRIWNEWHLGQEKRENRYICFYCLHLLHVGRTKHLVTCWIRNGEQKRGNFLVDLFDNNQTNTPRLLPVCQALDLVIGFCVMIIVVTSWNVHCCYD